MEIVKNKNLVYKIKKSKFHFDYDGIALLQSFFRSFLSKKRLKENILKEFDKKDNEIYTIRIRDVNFQSLINKKVKKIIREIIRIDSLRYYNFDNFLESFDNPNFNHNNIYENLKKYRFHLHPIAIISIFNSNEFQLYWGEWDLNGNREGFGIQVFADSAFYFGTFKKNKMDGVGIYIFPDKSEEIEETIKNLYDKKSLYKIKLSHSKKIRMDYNEFSSCFFSTEVNFIKNLNNENLNYYLYIGEFKENKFHGYGEIYQNLKESYIGRFSNDFIEGNGVFHFL